MVKADTFKRIGAEEVNLNEITSKCKHLKYDSDEFWECQLRNFAQTVYHPTSTCRMGPTNDPTSVVDPQLRYIHSCLVYFTIIIFNDNFYMKFWGSHLL